jgi:hypothetical protein
MPALGGAPGHRFACHNPVTPGEAAAGRPLRRVPGVEPMQEVPL